jgi:8-oxo-dGTP pyrophosphatase MutT (NUDIX family)
MREIERNKSLPVFLRKIYMMDFDTARITEALEKSFDPGLPPESPYPLELIHQKLLPAAVLLPFLWQDDEWRLLFIRRTYNEGDRHKGQVAFPGGQCNSKDRDSEAAALRETFEEIGMHQRDVKILGRLRDLLTITGYRVSPIVGLVPWPYPLIPQPSEVSRIFTIPLQWLADPGNRVVQSRDLRIQGKSIPVIYYKPYDGEILWGASARITVLLLEALGLSHPDDRYKG